MPAPDGVAVSEQEGEGFGPGEHVPGLGLGEHAADRADAGRRLVRRGRRELFQRRHRRRVRPPRVLGQPRSPRRLQLAHDRPRALDLATAERRARRCHLSGCRRHASETVRSRRVTRVAVPYAHPRRGAFALAALLRPHQQRVQHLHHSQI